MKRVYVGKRTDSGIEICKVIDSDILTGDALVFNRETKKFEVISIWDRVRLNPYIRKLAEDTPNLDYDLVKFTKIDNMYKIKIRVNSSLLTRVVDERTYKAIVNEMRVM